MFQKELSWQSCDFEGDILQLIFSKALSLEDWINKIKYKVKVVKDLEIIKRGNNFR